MNNLYISMTNFLNYSILYETFQIFNTYMRVKVILLSFFMCNVCYV